MKNALRVRGCQPRTQLLRNVDDSLRRQSARSLEQQRQIVALHQLHREEHGIVRYTCVEHPADRLMRDLPRQARLAQEARAGTRAC